MLTILTGDALEQLGTLPDESVQCCVTSPPYWGLRDYGTAAWEGGDENCDHSPEQRGSRFATPVSEKQRSNNGNGSASNRDCPCGAKRIDSQLGLEKTPEEYVAKMVEVFREVRRVLRKDGTLWLNLGDSYCSTAPGTMGDPLRQEGILAGVSDRRANGSKKFRPETPRGLKPKDMCGIPWRVAFALQADGWWLRSDIIWAKPNPMPESVTDRPTKSHEYLFLLTKSANYYYDAEAIKEPVVREWDPATNNPGWLAGKSSHQGPGIYPNGLEYRATGFKNGPSENGRNKRSVWTIATQPYPEAHFATYPPDLIKPCIMAGTSAKGCCSKCGAPWTRVLEADSTYGDSTDEYQGKQLQADEQHSSRRMILNTKRMRDQGRDHDNPFPVKQTLGWQPTCECDAAVQSCTVLDPFTGSGTTGAVALELGRKAILIELNPKYVELIKTRCDITPGLALA